MLTLADISQISQTLGSAAVVASLIFVGVQIRQNTKVTRAESHQGVSEALNQVNLLWARNSEAASIWLAGMSDRRALTPQDRWRFDAMLRAYLHVCESMYTQADLGAGDLGIVVAEDGRVCLSNNAADRVLRGIALGRRSWLFCGLDRGGQRVAAVYSLIVTCKMNNSVVLLTVLVAFPLVFSLKNGFHFWNLQMSPQPLGFIGLGNYTAIAVHPDATSAATGDATAAA